MYNSPEVKSAYPFQALHFTVKGQAKGKAKANTKQIVMGAIEHTQLQNNMCLLQQAFTWKSTRKSTESTQKETRITSIILQETQKNRKQILKSTQNQKTSYIPVFRYKNKNKRLDLTLCCIPAHLKF